MDNAFPHLILCSIVILIAGIHFASQLRKIGSLSTIDFVIWTSALYFGVGPWVAFAAGGGTLPHFELAHLFGAYVGVWLYFAGLLLAKWMGGQRPAPQPADTPAAPSGRLRDIFLSVGRANPVWFLCAYGLVIAVRLLLATQYGFAFSGTFTAKRLQYLPYHVFVLQAIVLSLGAGVTIWAACALWSRSPLRIMLIGLLTVESLYLFTQSRREIVGLIVILTFVYMVHKCQVHLKPLLGLAVAGCILWIWVMPAFYAIRIHLGQRASGDMVASVGRAIGDYVEGRSAGSMDLSYQKNLASRPLIIRFNCDIQRYQETGGLLLGRGLWSSVEAVVPRLLFPNKQVFNSEAFIQHEYGVPMTDTSANWPAAGMADFGLLGGLIAGLIMGGIIVIVERLAWRIRFKYPLVSFCLVGWVICTGFQVEQVPETQWNHLRSNILIYIFTAIVTAFVGGGSSEPAAEGSEMPAEAAYAPPPDEPGPALVHPI